MTRINLDAIDPGPFETRLSRKDINALSDSIKHCGQQIPIKVRPSKERGKFEIIYGHRRFEAVKNLGLQTIEAEIVEVNDEEAIISALVENLVRNDLSDYEKAVLFKKIHDEFNKTYEEIGIMIGKSKQYISNHISMLDLFGEERIRRDPAALSILMNLTEHHARILMRIRDEEERFRIASLVVKFNLCVRETDKLVGRVKSRFPKEEKELAEEILDDSLAKPGPYSIYRNGTVLWRMRPRRRVVIVGAKTLNYLISCIDKPKREIGREAARFFACKLASEVDLKRMDFAQKALAILGKLTGFGKFDFIDGNIIAKNVAVEDIDFL
ncbi:MAG: ParB/RepB/Spo0J family partition protein [Nitrososphaeria archaeon]